MCHMNTAGSFIPVCLKVCQSSILGGTGRSQRWESGLKVNSLTVMAQFEVSLAELPPFYRHSVNLPRIPSSPFTALINFL